MEKMHGKRNERCWHNMGGSKQESSRTGMCGGGLSVAYILTGVRGNDDDEKEQVLEEGTLTPSFQIPSLKRLK